MPSSSQLKINLSALVQNVKIIASASNTHIMAMIKANAYGTDPLFLAKLFQQIRPPRLAYLGVSHLSEAESLRESAITLPIFVLSVPPYEARRAARHRVSCAVSTLEEVDTLNQAAHEENVRLAVHLHIDTGMGRFGAQLEQVLPLYHAIKSSSHLFLEGIMTHFAAAEREEFDPFTYGQIESFRALLMQLPQIPRFVHAANSAGAMRFSLPFCTLSRIGLGMTGYGHCLDGMAPALTMTAPIVSISRLEKGASISYNCCYRVEKEGMRVGILPVGYYDGFPRSLSGKGYVLIKGKKAPMIGMICMDFMMIDLTDILEAQLGDEALLFGPDLRADQLGLWAGTDVRELLANLSCRIERVWTHPPLNLSGEQTDDTITKRLSSAIPTV